MPESREVVGGRQGYTIERVVTTNEQGDVVSESFELYDPNGDLVGTYSSLPEAEEALDEKLGPPPPGLGM